MGVDFRTKIAEGAASKQTGFKQKLFIKVKKTKSDREQRKIETE